MLNITRLLAAGEAGGDAPAPSPTAVPAVVVWNVTRRCNLACRHCYAAAAARPDRDELSPAEGRALIDALGQAGVAALVLSGGEPLLRPDLVSLAAHAAAAGLHTALSTNGTLLTPALARALGAAGVGYVGVSVDGLGPTHDRVRGVAGAWTGALAGLNAARAAGLRVGLRFTLCRSTLADLDGVLDLMEAEDVDRGYVSHLVHVGRARRLHREALAPAEARRALEALFDRARVWLACGRRTELVTGNNDADGPALCLWLGRRDPAAAARLRRRLVARGGNASGVAIAGVDVRGDVHPDQFWSRVTLGNVRARPFAALWREPADPLLALLRRRPRPVGGRCAACVWLDACQGGNRARAEALTGDTWAADPGCHLTDVEIGVEGRIPDATRVLRDAGSADAGAPLECAAAGPEGR